MAEIEPSEETCSLHTCSSSRKQYLRGKVPIPRTTLWRSGYRKQLRSLKEKTEKGRKLYCRDPFMPVPRQTLHNWRAAEEETSVQDMAEVPEIIASLDVDQQQSGVRENKETVVHESLEGEGFEDISERSSVESIKDVEDEDGGGCGGFIAEGSWESHSDEEYSGGDVGIRNDSGSSDGSSDYSSNEGGDSSDDVCSDEVFVGDGVAVGGGGDSSDDIGGDGSAVGGGGSDWGADGGNDSCGIGRGGGGDGHDGNDGEDEGDKDSFQDAEQITHPQKEIPMAEKKCCRQQCKGSTVCNFVILPFEDHLLQLCEENWDKLQYPFTRRQETDMQHDLQDGSKYRALMQPGEFLSVPEHIGLILCSDGIPVFKSSGLQLWPIELCIANLPPEIRCNVQYLLVGGLWLGSVKPDMNKILKPILTRIKKLEDSEKIIRTKVVSSKPEEKGQGLADLADGLTNLVNKAYPELEELALNHFLSQIESPDIAFSARQKRPKTIDICKVDANNTVDAIEEPKPIGANAVTSLPDMMKQHVRQVPPTQREVVKRLLDDMLRDDVIQPSSSPWASPIVLATKKDGSPHFYVDYHKLNEVTRKDVYPLIRIDKYLETLAETQLFSTLDLTSGDWQVELGSEDRQKTAFCTVEGLFEFKVIPLPFELHLPPFKTVLSGLQGTSSLVYLDDIIVMGKTFAEHLNNSDLVFSHIVSKDGIAADPERTAKVQQWPIPAFVKGNNSFDWPTITVGLYKTFLTLLNR
eukprot:Em0023g638a